MTEQQTPTFDKIMAENGGFDPTQLSNIEWSPPSWDQYRRDNHKSNVLDGIEDPTAEDLPWLMDIASGARWRLSYVEQMVAALRGTDSTGDHTGSPDTSDTGQRDTITAPFSSDNGDGIATMPLDIDSTEVEATQGGPEWDFPVDETPTSEIEVPEVPGFESPRWDSSLEEPEKVLKGGDYVMTSSNGGKLHIFAHYMTTLCGREVDEEATSKMPYEDPDVNEDVFCKDCKKKDQYLKDMAT